jgi:hypothetical protein
MSGLNRQMWSTVAVFVSLVPSPAPAQTVATTFEELRQVVKNGQTIVVTDTNGQRTKGKVRNVAVSPPSLVVLVPEARTMAEGTVAEIRTTDSLRNGGIIGGGVGLGLAMWDYLIDPSEPGNAAIFSVAIGLGTVIGVVIDSLAGGAKVLYRSRQQPRRLTLSPFAAQHRQGVLISVRF